jgi:hypothetical protein
VLSWFRESARPLAAALLVSLGTFGSFVVPHTDDCHADCLPAFVAHDADAHRIQDSTRADEPHALHCLVCHWARSFRPRPQGMFVGAPVVEQGGRTHIQSFTVARLESAAQPPLRSPPA